MGKILHRALNWLRILNYQVLCTYISASDFAINFFSPEILINFLERLCAEQKVEKLSNFFPSSHLETASSYFKSFLYFTIIIHLLMRYFLFDERILVESSYFCAHQARFAPRCAAKDLFMENKLGLHLLESFVRTLNW